MLKPTFLLATLCPLLAGWPAYAQIEEPSLLGPSDAVRLLPAPPIVKPRTPKPPAPPLVKWASPRVDAVLFRPATVVLDWTGTLPSGATYSVALSEDGKTFRTLLAEGVTGSHLQWTLPDLPRTTLYLRVKATAADGRTLGQDTVRVHSIPGDAILVSKQNQRLWAFRDGKLKYRYLVSTGQIDYDTRAGWFTVYNRREKHRSSIYDVDMPYALFFSGGQAIHSSTALRQLGSPASHGCIRLPRRHARALFEDTVIGRPVIITDWKQDASWLDGKRSIKAARGKAVSGRTPARR